MTLKDLLQSLLSQKKEFVFPTENREIEDLVCHFLEIPWSRLYLKSETQIDRGVLKKIEGAFQQLRSGRPLAYILGEKYFFESRFLVNDSVLIPRPETEILVEEAIKFLENRQGPKVMDLGAGSGCIGLSIAKHCIDSQVLLIDSEPGPIKVCEANISQLGLKNCFLKQAIVGDSSFDLPLAPPFDLITANPPYIAVEDPRVDPRVRRFEPSAALFAGQQGEMWIHKWLAWGYTHLEDGGCFLMEIGAGQSSRLIPSIEELRPKSFEFLEDYSRKERIIKLVK